MSPRPRRKPITFPGCQAPGAGGSWFFSFLRKGTRPGRPEALGHSQLVLEGWHPSFKHRVEGPVGSSRGGGVPVRTEMPWVMIAALFGRGHRLAFEQISFLHLFIYFLWGDSAKQPQNRAPKAARKSQTLKRQCSCEVFAGGTFLKITAVGDGQGAGGDEGDLEILGGF